MKDVIHELIQKEQFNILEDAGYGRILDKIRENHRQCFTKGGRLNKSGCARTLGLRPKDVVSFFAACRALLER